MKFKNDECEIVVSQYLKHLGHWLVQVYKDDKVSNFEMDNLLEVKQFAADIGAVEYTED